MKRTYKFYVETRYVGSRVTEDIELDFDDDATEEEIESEVEEVYKDWMSNECEGGWEISKV